MNTERQQAIQWIIDCVADRRYEDDQEQFDREIAELARVYGLTSDEIAAATGQFVCSKQIQHDNSGVGHNWRSIDANEIPADIREEIEGEIIDGKKETCGDFIAGDGLHYRW